VLGKIERQLQAHGMGLADVVAMRVYLVAPPGAHSMDFEGMMRGYRRSFGTASQPNKPARTTVQIAGLVNPAYLVEIEATAAQAGKER
jgi:enamine deaminase RidA (YjgF/YER057c/UK114 family)